MIFRLSQTLKTKIQAGTLAVGPLDDNPFADWTAQLFLASRTQYILLSNTKSLHSTVMYGKGITGDGYFIERALGNIREFMATDGQEFVYRRFIVPATVTVRFAKALSRSTTGSMNELVRQAKVWLADGDISPMDVGFRVNEILMSALSPGRSSGYGTPRDAFRALLDDNKE